MESKPFTGVVNAIGIELAALLIILIVCRLAHC